MQVRPKCGAASSSAPAWPDTRTDAREFAAGGVVAPSDPLGWNSFALPTAPTDFVAGLHNGMVSHGPEAAAFERASNATLGPHELEDTLAFMFERSMRLVPTVFAMTGGALDACYADCRSTLEDRFAPWASTSTPVARNL
jgi:homogentisate 1,2-dioxygenase